MVANDKSEDMDRRIAAATTCARYMAPQLKAVEHKGEITTRQIMDVDSLVARDAARAIIDSMGLH